MTELATDVYRLRTLNEQTPPKTDSWAPINLNTLPDKPPIQPNLGNTGLLYPGKRHVFSGPPDSAKTIAAYCVLISTIRTGATGVLIDFEMGAYDARQRLQELGANACELDHVFYVEPDERATPDRINTLVQLAPTLVVVDAAAGAYDMEGLDDNHRKDVEALTRLYVKAFWRNGIATLFIDHVAKNADTRGRFMIGSERKLGGVDVHYGFDTITPVSRGTSGRYKLIIHRDRGGYLKRGHIADLELESDPDTHQIGWRCIDPKPATAEAGYFRPTHLMEKVSIDLEHRSEPATRNNVYDALGGTKDYVLKAITALVTEGFLAETDGPNRSKLLASTRRYREDNPVDNPTSDPVDNPSGSVVRTWFDSGSANHLKSGGSVVRNPYGYEPLRPPTPDQPNPNGWFDQNDELEEAPFDAAYMEATTPDESDPA